MSAQAKKQAAKPEEQDVKSVVVSLRDAQRAKKESIELAKLSRRYKVVRDLIAENKRLKGS